MIFKSSSFLYIFSAFILTACSKGPQKVTDVYYNDFELIDLNGITGGKVSDYNQSKVLGKFNNDGFGLDLGNLPEHDMVTISFDLYIHDTWEGNEINENGPDIWQMEVQGDLYMNTTFSNCSSGFCLPQSYPLSFLNNKNSARTGAYRNDLPGACHYGGLPGGTSQYKISKTVRHSGEGFNMRCLDKLIQKNTADAVCDESWSVDNLDIKVISLN